MNISPAIATIIAAIVTTVVSAAVTLLVCIINSKTQHAKYVTELSKQNSLVVYRLEQLEQKVERHNHFDSRLVALEEQVKTLFNRTHE